MGTLPRTVIFGTNVSILATHSLPAGVTGKDDDDEQHSDGGANDSGDHTATYWGIHVRNDILIFF